MTRRERPLTEHQFKILRLVAAGLSNREVGEQLYVSTSTINNTLRGIYQKLGASNRTEAVALMLTNFGEQAKEH